MTSNGGQDPLEFHLAGVQGYEGEDFRFNVLEMKVLGEISGLVNEYF